MNLTEFRQHYTPLINGYLETHLKEEINNKKISQIMAYSVMAGGKRLRPLIYLATLKTLGYQIETSDLQTACGIELIHTYSLIHDDLPAMDNDDYRRGMLTSHKKWGEAEAILAGDALLPLGIQWIAEGSKNITEVEIITQAVGPNGMVGGQYLDIDSTNNSSVKDNNEFISQMEWLKTGCLLQACVEMAITKVKEKNADKIAALKQFAYTFGRSYQIYDDLVDVVESSQEAGKVTHKDEAEGKNNTLTLLGIDRSRQELIELVNQGRSALKIFDEPILAQLFELYEKVL